MSEFCNQCGQAVRIHQADEGTGSYEGIEYQDGIDDALNALNIAYAKNFRGKPKNLIADFFKVLHKIKKR